MRLDVLARKTGGLWAQGLVERYRGVLADGVQADAAFERAIEAHNACAMPFELARTRLCFGQRLRRAGLRVEARRQLREALATSQPARAALGGADLAWAGASGGHSSKRGDSADRDQRTLKSSRSARFIAQGATNREAAADLFLSPKTIETHLPGSTASSASALSASSRWVDTGAGTNPTRLSRTRPIRRPSPARIRLCPSYSPGGHRGRQLRPGRTRTAARPSRSSRWHGGVDVSTPGVVRPDEEDEPLGLDERVRRRRRATEARERRKGVLVPRGTLPLRWGDREPRVRPSLRRSLHRCTTGALVEELMGKCCMRSSLWSEADGD